MIEFFRNIYTGIFYSAQRDDVFSLNELRHNAELLLNDVIEFQVEGPVGRDPIPNKKIWISAEDFRFEKIKNHADNFGDNSVVRIHFNRKINYVSKDKNLKSISFISGDRTIEQGHITTRLKRNITLSGILSVASIIISFLAYRQTWEGEELKKESYVNSLSTGWIGKSNRIDMKISFNSPSTDFILQKGEVIFPTELHADTVLIFNEQNEIEIQPYLNDSLMERYWFQVAKNKVSRRNVIYVPIGLNVTYTTGGQTLLLYQIFNIYFEISKIEKKKKKNNNVNLLGVVFERSYSTHQELIQELDKKWLKVFE